MSDAQARARARRAEAGAGGWREVVAAHRRAGLWPLVRLGTDHDPVAIDLDMLHAYALRLPGAANEQHRQGRRPLIHRWPDGWAPLGITCALFAASTARPWPYGKAASKVARVDQVLLAVRTDGAALVVLNRANRGAWAAWDPDVTTSANGSRFNPWVVNGGSMDHRPWEEMDPGGLRYGAGFGSAHAELAEGMYGIGLRGAWCCGGGAFRLYCWQSMAKALAQASAGSLPRWSMATDGGAMRAARTGRPPDGLTWEQVKDWHHTYVRWSQGGERPPSRRRYKAREARRCARVALEVAPTGPLFPEGGPGQDRGPDEPELWPTEEWPSERA